ncbi:MAG: multicopper oxidase domain-containing protein, partial [Gemmatimonadaceae bacterium]
MSAFNRRTTLTIIAIISALGIAQFANAESIDVRLQQPPTKPPTQPPVKKKVVTPTTTAKSDKKPVMDSMSHMKMPMHMDGMDMGGMQMGMPIPMPKGMPMIPGLMGLKPEVASFLPGIGVSARSLPMVRLTQTVRLKDGDTLDLTAELVRRTINGKTFVMYAFNGMVPGPIIRVPQRATVTVRFHNRIDLPSTVHWHGLRQDNKYDGVPGLTQNEVKPGQNFTYRVYFPDAGVYWYHPHVREDIEQAMGLFGNMLVDAPERDYYAPANREQALVFDDLLINADTLIPFGKETPTFALMGRVGNVLTVNGETNYKLAVKRGEVVRFYLTNVSSSRTYNLSFGNAKMKVVASDV